MAEEVAPAASPVDGDIDVDVDGDVEVEDGHRSSIEKMPLPEEPPLTAFERLPDEIIQQILQVTDSNGFASLALLNTKWRSVAQDPDLYAHHLANCPSFAMSHRKLPKTISDETLPQLRKMFAREVKRNLFEAYLRPSQTVIKLISTSISSSSCPGGEGIQFSPSPKGHHLLAYNSSRIYVIDVRTPDIEVKRELKILRRPAAICVKDDGSLLAVLLTEMQVDLYDLTQTPPKRTQSIILDNSPRAIALSPCGTVLAAAYEGGIEVSSLNPGALPTDRRAVKCDAVDALAFSFDGTQILGTTVQSSQPNTVILTAPYYDPGGNMGDETMSISSMWTTSILFPNTSRDCSHAVFIQNGSDEEANWTFTYDRSFETFRAVRIDDLRNGKTYFTGPISCSTSQAKLIPCTLPAASFYGDLVAAGFEGKEVWLYGVPEDLDAVPDPATVKAHVETESNTEGLIRRGSAHSAMRSPGRIQQHESARVPPWQVLCDNLRNTLVEGYNIGELEGVNTVKWVADFGNSALKERLIVAARGISPTRSITEDEGMDFEDGGRLTLFDFDYGTENGETREIIIEVGTKEPEVLEEEHRDIETEVAIVRRRTVMQKRVSRAAVMRAATTASRAPPLPNQGSSSTQPDDADEDDPLLPRRIGVIPVRRAPEQPSSNEDGETESILEEQEALDAPYSHASPRSVSTLRRAATAAAASRRHQPTASTSGQYEYRRADGRREHPHESDADNWVPPPPPYQKEDPGDMPAFMRHTMNPDSAPDVQEQLAKKLKHQSQPYVPVPPLPDQLPPRSQSVAPIQRRLPSDSSIPPVPPLPPMPFLPQVPVAAVQVTPAPAHGPVASNPLGLHTDPPSRPRTSDSRYLDGDNIYDVSPPDSPTRATRTLAEPVRNDSRAASFATANSEPNTMNSAHSAALAVNHDVDQNIASSPPQAQPPPPPTVSGGMENTPPALNLQIPSPSLGSVLPPIAMDQTAPVPGLRRLSNSQTWPLQPPPQPYDPSVPTGPANFPYSAPPADLQNHPAMALGYPPAPNPEQVASQTYQPEFSPRHAPGGFSVPRVPVGSRANMDFSQRRSYAQPPLPQQPPPVPEHEPPLPPPPIQQGSPERLYYTPPPPPSLNHPLPRRPSEMSPVPLGEDIPLIISTPKGVQGAFDPPDRRISGRRAEAPILAPVPRHPRPNSQAAILRPTAERPERLEPIYPAGTLPLAGPSNANNNIVHHQLLVPPGPPSGPPSSVGLSGRVGSISRRQSRAERSAAKNMADAKKRGWTGRRRSKSTKKKKGGKERDFDVASSAAWTDVTTNAAPNRRSMAFLPARPGTSGGVAARAAAWASNTVSRAGGGGQRTGEHMGEQFVEGKGGHKCVVM